MAISNNTIKNHASGIVIAELFVIAAFLLFADQRFFQLVTGKISLTKEGKDLQDALTDDAKLAIAWLVGAFLLVAMTEVAPVPGLLIATILLLQVFLSHAQPVLAAFDFVAKIGARK